MVCIKEGHWYATPLALLVIAVLIIGGIMKAHHVEEYKIYSDSGYYSPNISSKQDPRKIYSEQIGQSVLTMVKCDTVMSEAKDKSFCNGYNWILENKDILTSDILKDYISSEEGDHVLAGNFADGESIVSPTILVFLNSNTRSVREDGSIFIEVAVGSDYKIIFDNVKSWWCHNGKSGSKQHTTTIGQTGIYEKCSGGYIIGETSESTTVSLYVKNGDGSYVPSSWYKFYSLDKPQT